MSATEQGDWVTIYTGRGPVLEALEQSLTDRGITVVRQEYPELGGQFEVGIFGTGSASNYNLAVPADEYESRHDEIDAALQEIAGSGEGDLAAQVQAEEDYDVRGCPACRLFFHDNYAACPHDGTELVPAVDCFGPGQMSPDVVIVGHGAAAEPIAQRLDAAGFTAGLVSPPGWNDTVVSLPWAELIGRTSEAEAAIAGQASLPL